MILIMGYPNAGKTTFSKRYQNVLHLDDFGKSKFKKCNEAVTQADHDVVVDGIYNTVRRRIQLLESCKTKHKRICIWLDTPIEECIQREHRCRLRGDAVVKKNAQMFEPPTLSEGWDEIIIIKEYHVKSLSN